MPRPAPRTPSRSIFQTLGRDPIRSAALVTPTFHARHGLRIQSAWTDTASLEQPFRLSSAELAWLGVQRRAEYLAYVPKLVVTDIEVRRSDSQQAVVVAQVAAPAVPPFLQRFFLVRSGPDAPWQIDRIEQEGVVPANKTAAFVASPSRADGRRAARQRALRKGRKRRSGSHLAALDGLRGIAATVVVHHSVLGSAPRIAVARIPRGRRSQIGRSDAGGVG